MGKALYLPHAVGRTEFGRKHNTRKERRRSAALAGNTEFFFEVGVNVRDRGEKIFLFHTVIINRLILFVKQTKKNRKNCVKSLEIVCRL